MATVLEDLPEECGDELSSSLLIEFFPYNSISPGLLFLLANSREKVKQEKYILFNVKDKQLHHFKKMSYKLKKYNLIFQETIHQ